MELKELAKVLEQQDFLVKTKDEAWGRFTNPRLYAVNFHLATSDSLLASDFKKIHSSAKKIQEFIELLLQKNPRVLRKYFKEIFIQYHVGNEFRGSGSSPSWIVTRKIFSDEINLIGYYKWLDKGWGDYSSELSYDPSALEKILQK